MNYFDRKRVKEILTKNEEMKEIIVLGWVRTKRESKNVAFIELNDGSTLNNLQIVIDGNDIANFPLNKISTGASIKVVGNVIKSQGKEQGVELIPTSLEVIGEADESFPLQKKRHTVEFLREIAHLRPRTNLFGVVNRFRSKIAFAIHNFFQERGFHYVHTPMITTNDAEGAGECFQVTTFDLDKIPRIENKIDFSQDFFGNKANLTVSGQLEAEIMSLALGDVYTFGPTFRAENSNTTRHLSEFWMIEPEMAFAELADDVKIAESFLKYLFNYALTECREEMEFFNKFIDNTRIATLESIIKSDFEVVTYTDAIKILEDSKHKFEYPVKWGIDMQSEHERYLTEVHFKKPIAVTNYPKEIKSFYMKQNDDGKTVAAMDILVPQVGEIIGGSQREDRYEYLKKAMEAKGIPLDSETGLWWYLELRKNGSVPHAGFGLGFCRVLMYMSGITNVRDIIPFPRTPKNAKF